MITVDNMQKLDLTHSSNPKLSTTVEEKILWYFLIKNSPKEIQKLFSNRKFLGEFYSIALVNENIPFYDNHVFILLYGNNHNVSLAEEIQTISKLTGYSGQSDVRIDGIPFRCLTFCIPFKYADRIRAMRENAFSMDKSLEENLNLFWNDIPKKDRTFRKELSFESMVVPKEQHQGLEIVDFY